MKKLLTFLLVLFVLTPTFSLFGCAKTQTSDKVIRVCNCEDYIDESIFEDFTDEDIAKFNKYLDMMHDKLSEKHEENSCVRKTNEKE